MFSVKYIVGVCALSLCLIPNLQRLSAQTQPFSATVAPSEVKVAAGATATYTFTLAAPSGFTGNVSLAVSGLPALATASFTPQVINAANPSSTLKITAPASVTDSVSYMLSVSETSGSTTQYQSIILDITGDDSNPSIIKRLKVVNHNFSTSIPATTLFNASGEGLYRINAYMVLTGTDPNRNNIAYATANVNWTDETGAQTTVVTTCGADSLAGQNNGLVLASLSAVGTYCGLAFTIDVESATTVTFSVPIQNPEPPTSPASYSLFITAEKL